MKDKFDVEAQILPEPGEKEIWLPAPKYEDRYEISSFGNLRYKKTKRLRTICYDNGGYPIVCLKINNKVHSVYIHRLVCEAFNGAPTPENNICDHRDRCIVNNYYKNLHWTNHAGNYQNHKPFNDRQIFVKKTPVVFLDLNGRLIQRYENIIQASEETGFSIQQIRQNVYKRRRPFQNGYFRTEEDYLSSFDG